MCISTVTLFHHVAIYRLALHYIYIYLRTLWLIVLMMVATHLDDLAFAYNEPVMQSLHFTAQHQTTCRHCIASLVSHLCQRYEHHKTALSTVIPSVISHRRRRKKSCQATTTQLLPCVCTFIHLQLYFAMIVLWWTSCMIVWDKKNLSSCVYKGNTIQRPVQYYI